MSNHGQAGRSGLSRRQVIGGVAAGAAAAWVAPELVSVGARAAASPAPGIMYGTSNNSSLYVVDTTTGAFSPLIGPTGQSRAWGMTYDSTGGILYGITWGSGLLCAVDTGTGAWSGIGATAGIGAVGIAHDSLNDVLYGCGDVGTHATYTVDRSTGAWTLVGPVGGTPGPTAMAYDAANDVLYGCTRQDTYIVNRATGAWTLLGATGVSDCWGMTYDPDADILYGLGAASSVLCTVDRGTGAWTAVGGLTGVLLPRSIAYVT